MSEREQDRPDPSEPTVTDEEREWLTVHHAAIQEAREASGNAMPDDPPSTYGAFPLPRETRLSGDQWPWFLWREVKRSEGPYDIDVRRVGDEAYVSLAGHYRPAGYYPQDIAALMAERVIGYAEDRIVENAETRAIDFTETDRGPYMPIVCVDFDGVVHSYVKPWGGVDIIPDPPVPGAFDWLKSLLPDPSGDCEGHPRAVIYSSRSKSSAGRRAMREWFERHGFPPEFLVRLEFAAEKPPAFLTVDDRAVCFEGDFSALTVNAIRAFVPWNKRGDRKPSGLTLRHMPESLAALHEKVAFHEQPGGIGDNSLYRTARPEDKGVEFVERCGYRWPIMWLRTDRDTPRDTLSIMLPGDGEDTKPRDARLPLDHPHKVHAWRDYLRAYVAAYLDGVLDCEAAAARAVRADRPVQMIDGAGNTGEVPDEAYDDIIDVTDVTAERIVDDEEETAEEYELDAEGDALAEGDAPDAEDAENPIAREAADSMEYKPSTRSLTTKVGERRIRGHVRVRYPAGTRTHTMVAVSSLDLPEKFFAGEAIHEGDSDDEEAIEVTARAVFLSMIVGAYESGVMR